MAFREPEGEWLELERGNANPRETGEYVSALANAAVSGRANRGAHLTGNRARNPQGGLQFSLSFDIRRKFRLDSI